VRLKKLAQRLTGGEKRQIRGMRRQGIIRVKRIIAEKVCPMNKEEAVKWLKSKNVLYCAG